ncbi:hypothetical protein M422DRAFT_28565 [Sphaerobolus stellatus SS14]|uniref:Uncharacterized protein n=1 Tax=Sphaerobolus stellatus (strain SS14) TaxID=990650 RepID=A0A0C9W4Z8_SPHS4|nr:hypothetical protein M422DRAFT_28565 [Sphaerobolus stellatus SS14]
MVDCPPFFPSAGFSQNIPTARPQPAPPTLRFPSQPACIHPPQASATMLHHYRRNMHRLRSPNEALAISQRVLVAMTWTPSHRAYSRRPGLIEQLNPGVRCGEASIACNSRYRYRLSWSDPDSVHGSQGKLTLVKARHAQRDRRDRRGTCRGLPLDAAICSRMSVANIGLSSEWEAKVESRGTGPQRRTARQPLAMYKLLSLVQFTLRLHDMDYIVF